MTDATTTTYKIWIAPDCTRCILLVLILISCQEGTEACHEAVLVLVLALYYALVLALA